MPRWVVHPDQEPSKRALALAEQVEKDGGRALALYRDPVGEHWQLFCLLPLAKVEAAHFVTLGLLYEKNARFAGGAFAPILRRVDKFLKGSFPKTLAEREERAARVAEADEALARVVARLKKRGISHPYVKTFVLARTTPLTRQRKTLPSFDHTFKKLAENLESFDASRVRYEDIQRAGLMAAPAAS